MPAIKYYNKAGNRIPSVTTITKGLGWDKDGLLFWAFKEGKTGKKELYEKSAAQAGTLAHMLVESYLKEAKVQINLEEYSIELIEMAENAFNMFKRWFKGLGEIEVIATELSLVSEKYQVGGTMDMVFRMGDELSILDLKTGSTYAEQLIQIGGAYVALWNENYPDHPVNSFNIIRTGREEAIFQHKYYADLPKALRAFELLRELYEINKDLKKLI